MVSNVNVDGVRIIANDHILNLIPEATGQFMRDKASIINKLEEYLNLSQSEKMVFKVGRRLGWLHSIDDLKQDELRKAVESVIQEKEITEENVDRYCERMMEAYI